MTRQLILALNQNKFFWPLICINITLCHSHYLDFTKDSIILALCIFCSKRDVCIHFLFMFAILFEVYQKRTFSNLQGISRNAEAVRFDYLLWRIAYRTKLKILSAYDLDFILPTKAKLKSLESQNLWIIRFFIKCDYILFWTRKQIWKLFAVSQRLVVVVAVKNYLRYGPTICKNLTLLQTKLPP